MRRVVVMGQSGSGKTTFARALAGRLGVPYIELDAHQHLAEWTPNPRFTDDVAAALRDAGDAWVVDGNYLVAREVTLARADTVVWLDYPRWLPVARAARRTAGRLRNHEPLWNGNTERWSNLLDAGHPIWWAWTTAPAHRRDFPAAYAEFPRLRVERLHRPRQAAAFLAAAPQQGE